MVPSLNHKSTAVSSFAVKYKHTVSLQPNCPAVYHPPPPLFSDRWSYLNSFSCSLMHIWILNRKQRLNWKWHTLLLNIKTFPDPIKLIKSSFSLSVMNWPRRGKMKKPGKRTREGRDGACTPPCYHGNALRVTLKGSSDIIQLFFSSIFTSAHSEKHNLC